MDAIVYDKVGKEAEKVREALYGIYPQATITDTAIASIGDGADGIPVKELIVGVEPVQDLHGYDHPWPEGGGKNLLKPTGTTQTINGVTFTMNADGSVTANGTATEDARFVVGYFTLKAETAVKYNGSVGGTAQTYCVAYSGYPNAPNGDVTADRTSVTTDWLNAPFYVIVFSGATVSNKTFYPMIRLATEVDATFEPYSNICPISGWTGAEIEQRGKNLLDVSTFRPGAFDASTQFPNNNVATNGYINIKPGTYVWSQLHYGVDGGRYYRIYDEEKNQIGANAFYSDSAVTFTVPQNGRYIRYMLYRSTPPFASLDDVLALQPQIGLGSTATATDYEPYTGKTVDIDWETEAGTVYGGTLTIDPDRTGTLVVDKADVDMGDLTWTYNQSSGHERFISSVISPSAKPAPGDTQANAICSMYKTATSNQVFSHSADCIFCVDGDGKIQVYDSGYTDTNAFKTAVTGQKVVYELANPITYTLTASEIDGILTTLYGTNNIFADCGDIEKLTYRADLGKYIDSHITTAVANALNA